MNYIVCVKTDKCATFATSDLNVCNIDIKGYKFD